MNALLEKSQSTFDTGEKDVFENQYFVITSYCWSMGFPIAGLWIFLSWGYALLPIS